MKNSLVCTGLFMFVTSSALAGFTVRDADALLQKKYPGVAGTPAAVLAVPMGKITAKTCLVPALTQLGLTKKNQPLPYDSILTTQGCTPYMIVPDDQYQETLARYKGYADHTENFVNVNKLGKTLVLKASDVTIKGPDGKVIYPGLANQAANHVMIDQVETVFVKKSEYRNYLNQHMGYAELPANYVLDGSNLNHRVQVISLDDTEYVQMFGTTVPEKAVASGKNAQTQQTADAQTRPQGTKQSDKAN